MPLPLPQFEQRLRHNHLARLAPIPVGLVLRQEHFFLLVDAEVFGAAIVEVGVVAYLAEVDESHEYLESAVEDMLNVTGVNVRLVDGALLVGQSAKQYLG